MEKTKVTVIHKPSEKYFVASWVENGITKYKHFCYLVDTTTEQCKQEYVKEEALRYAKLVEDGKIIDGEEIIYQTEN